MSANFEKLNPSDLKKAAVVPQVLDNQWVPQKILQNMIGEKKSLSDVKAERADYVLKEWRRALVYGEQAIVNRAFMFNSEIVVDDYDDKENREHFKKLLENKVIIPYLITEDSPAQKPPFPVQERLWTAWQEILDDTNVACIRLDWGDQHDDFKRLSSIYHTYIQTLNLPGRAEHIGSYLHLQNNALQNFRKRLQEVSSFATDLANEKNRTVTRNDLYEKFVVIDGSNSSEGRYSDKAFAAEIKQIVDLKYNVNLPDALGRYSLTPEDSLPRIALGDLQDVINAPIIDNKNVEDIIGALRKLAFDQITSGMYLQSLKDISLGDVLTIRSTDEWEQYRLAMYKLLENPLDFSIGSAKFYEQFEALNRRITQVRVERAKSKWEPWVKFFISVGAKAVELAFNPADPSQKLLSFIGSGAVTTGITPFVMRMTVGALTEKDADLDVSLDFMRNKVVNGRDVWNEIVGQLKSDPSFKEVKKAIANSMDANQNMAEAQDVNVYGY